jgi:hypothetical protein
MWEVQEERQERSLLIQKFSESAYIGIPVNR